MHGKNYAQRRYDRYVKGMRRVRQDRAEHGADRRCDCFEAQVDQGRGATFDRFADTPKRGWCCGNPRKMAGPTVQELRGPTVKDWE